MAELKPLRDTRNAPLFTKITTELPRSYFKAKMKSFRLYEITFNNGQAVDNAANT